MYRLHPLLEILTGFSLLLTSTAIVYYKWKYTYWKKKNLPYLQPTIPFGNLQSLVTTTDSLGMVLKRLYEELKRKNHPHGGVYFFARHIYMVVNVENIDRMLSKDFHHFVDRGLYYNEKDDPISAHLFCIGGKKWRNLRVQLSETFTSGKIKAMFDVFTHCEKNLQEIFEILHQKKQPIDIKDVLSCFTTDVIGRCAFGMNCDTLKDKDYPLRTYVKKFFTYSIGRLLVALFTMNFPNAARNLNIKAVPKDISNFFDKLFRNIVHDRETNNYVKDDYIQILINMKNSKLARDEGYNHDGKTVTIEELTAQSFLLFVAGVENASIAPTWALYELAKNQEIQQKVRNEINIVMDKHDGKITYDTIQEMTYMNQVLYETLRKYPPIPFLNRQCVKDYKIPEHSVIIERGTRVVIPVLGIHYDEEYYPDPDKFDPERFDEKKLTARHRCCFIPFGFGPRMCLGLRFAMMQAKVVLTSLLKNYNFTLNEKTKEPLKFSKNSVSVQAEGGIWLDVKKY